MDLSCPAEVEEYRAEMGSWRQHRLPHGWGEPLLGPPGEPKPG